MDSTDKHLLDMAAVSTGVATYGGILPSIAALLTIVWLGIRIIESHTVQSIKDKVLKQWTSKG